MNKIAIIEDDIDICNMIAKFLENNKYIVHYALNGAEGIELCKSLLFLLRLVFQVEELPCRPAYRNCRQILCMCPLIL